MLVLPLFAIVANWARLEIVRAVNEASGPARVDLYSVPQVVKVRGVGSKIQQTKMLVTCQRFGDLFLLGWSGGFGQKI